MVECVEARRKDKVKWREGKAVVATTRVVYESRGGRRGHFDTCRRLVLPTEIDSHSMFHQTLIPYSSSSSSLFFKPSSSSLPLLQLPSLVPPLVYSNCAQVGREATMEEALRSSLRPETGLCTGHQQQQQNKVTLSEERGWVAERGNLSDEVFSVDDLLNLGDYAENDNEAEVVEESEVQAKHMERGGSNSSSPSSSTSGLSFQPPPPLPPPLSDISLPAHDAEELEWVSFIIDDSLTEFPHCPGVPHFPSPPQSHKESEIPAAAEQGSSSLRPGRSPEAMVPVKAKRSKRFRARSTASSAARHTSGLVPFADSASSATTNISCSSSSSSSSSGNTSASCLIYGHHPASSQSFLLYDTPPPPAPAKRQAPKKRGRKPKPSAPSAPGSGERRCSHCGAQKTPQWRAGPLGAKTLCNACGVRFKSGRLLPEYRPACSPTFVSHIHSNSHRKVLEMRRKKEAELLLSDSASPVASF